MLKLYDSTQKGWKGKLVVPWHFLLDCSLAMTEEWANLHGSRIRAMAAYVHKHANRTEHGRPAAKVSRAQPRKDYGVGRPEEDLLSDWGAEAASAKSWPCTSRPPCHAPGVSPIACRSVPMVLAGDEI